LPREKPNLRDAEPGYVLHSYAFKETSLVVEVFTRGFGRLGLVAKGARRPRSALRGVLMAFQPLLLSWSGKSELRLLHRAEWQAGEPQMAGLSLMCGFYLNELLLKLVARDDPHEELYDSYEQALAALRTGEAQAVVLRLFEQRMLTELGYALPLHQDVHGAAVDPGTLYTYLVERGPVRVDEFRGAGELVEVTGKTLLDMARGDYSDPGTLHQSRALMRHVINHYLGGQTLHTRQLLRDMQQL
jgi:DNA repair protein RecO (recombination protein O)